MKPLVAVVDYEMGNLHSVSKALEKAGARIRVTSNPSEVRRAAGIVVRPSRAWVHFGGGGQAPSFEDRLDVDSAY